MSEGWLRRAEMYPKSSGLGQSSLRPWDTRSGAAGSRPSAERVSFVRNLERAGVPRSVAMKLTGHLTELICRRYAIVSPADLKAGVEKLAKLHVERTEPAKVVVILGDRKKWT